MTCKTSQFHKIDSLPNLRILCRQRSENCTATASPDVNANAALYRSSKPDRIMSEDLPQFRQLGIRSIIDFRSKEEYLHSDGHRYLDQEYSLYVVKVPKRNYLPGDSVSYELVSKSSCDEALDTFEKQHFLINFFSLRFVFSLFKQLPWHIKLTGVLYLLYDLIFRNKFKSFTNFFVENAINVKGIAGQYVDIIESSQASICSALKLITIPENLPALINCAHGKDRTGIVSALILTCMGMPKAFVAEEYALSDEGLAPIKHLVRKDIMDKYHLKEEFCSSKADTMWQLLTYIEDKYGSVEDYMVHIGFSREEQNTMKNTMEAYDHRHHSDEHAL